MHMTFFDVLNESFRCSNVEQYKVHVSVLWSAHDTEHGTGIETGNANTDASTTATRLPSGTGA